jgi:uncharacterized protein (DUF58 family)
VTQTAAQLRTGAEGLAGGLPALLASASQLAASVMPGAHGRRRSGVGDEFWQYRPAHGSDVATRIDWRRSARSDAHFVRETEWQAAQSVVLWVDSAQSMLFHGAPDRGPKLLRAQLVSLALTILLIRGGERVGLMTALQGIAPRSGQTQLMHIATALANDLDPRDFGAPGEMLMPSHSRAVFVSDFLGDIDPLRAAMGRAADCGVQGVLLQVLDPVEEVFPFDGRSIFESMSGALRHETLRASDLRSRYQTRLAERKDALGALARATGWQFHTHHSDTPAAHAVLWLYAALGQGY